ncbi:unnamed protein product [Heligmosomoides polygyrus]|uniref:Copper transport protein n=1 Tax=Heligmosomoides polygyrus TaxID=6339 RepID=A0A183FW57_HELPZ|nr:unnamed protein product [Heligmosomoides polygyrus]
MNMAMAAMPMDGSTHMDMDMGSTPMHHMKMKPMWMWFHTTVNDVVLFESWTIVFRQTATMMMMMMYFHFRIQEPILIREWMASNLTGYVFSCVGVAVIAAVYELIKFSRVVVENAVNRQNAECKIDDLFVDLRDGFSLIALLEVLTGERLPRENGYTRFHRIQNVQYCLDFLKKKNVSHC